MPRKRGSALAPLTPDVRFRELQAAAFLASEYVRQQVITLEQRYGPGGTAYATAGERTKLAKLRTSADQTSDAFVDYLHTVQTRDFMVSVPVWWLLAELTYADATTLEAMAVVPPPAWGFTDRDSRVFAAAVVTLNRKD